MNFHKTIFFFDKTLLKEIENFVIQGNSRINLFNLSNSNFNPSLSKLSESLVIPFSYLEKENFYNTLKNKCLELHKKFKCNLNLDKSKILIYPSGYDGIVHLDSFDEKAKNNITTITFLNNDWDRTWGGEILLYDKKISKVIAGEVPEFSKTFIFNSNMPHRAISPIRLSSLYRIVLVTKTKLKNAE